MKYNSVSASRFLVSLLLIELLWINSTNCFVDIFMSAEESQRLIGIYQPVPFVQNGSVESYMTAFLLPLLPNVTELNFSWQRHTELPVQYSIDFPDATQYASLMHRPVLSIQPAGVVPQRLSGFSVGLQCTPDGLREPKQIKFFINITVKYQQNITELNLQRSKVCTSNIIDLSRRPELIRNRSETSADRVTQQLANPNLPLQPSNVDRSVAAAAKKTSGSSRADLDMDKPLSDEQENENPGAGDEAHAQTAPRSRSDELQWSASVGSSSSSSAFTYYVGIACSSGVIVALALCFAICYVYQKRRLISASNAGSAANGTNLALVSETTVVPLGGVTTAMHTRNTLLVNLGGGSRLNANANVDVRFNAATAAAAAAAAAGAHWSSASSNGGSAAKSKRGGNAPGIDRAGRHRGAYLAVPFRNDVSGNSAAPYANDAERELHYPTTNTPTLTHSHAFASMPNTPRLGVGPAPTSAAADQFSPDGFSVSSASASQAGISHPNSRASHGRPAGDTSASASCANSCTYSPAPPPTPNADGNAHSVVHGTSRSSGPPRRAASSSSRHGHSHHGHSRSSHSHSRYVQQVFAARRRMLAAQREAGAQPNGMSRSDATYQLSISLPPPPACYAAMSDTQSQFSAATGSNVSYSHAPSASVVSASARATRSLRLAHACAGPPPSCGSSTISDGMSVMFGRNFGEPPLDAAGPCATSPLAMSVVTSLSGTGTPSYNAPGLATGGPSQGRPAFSVPSYSELSSLFATVRADRDAIVIERSTCVFEGTFSKLFAARIRLRDAPEPDGGVRGRLERALQSRSLKNEAEGEQPAGGSSSGSFCVLLKTVNEVGVHVHDEQIRVLLSDASLLIGCAHTNVAPLVSAVLSEADLDADHEPDADDSETGDSAMKNSSGGRSQASRVPMLIYPLPAFGILKLFLLEQASQFAQPGSAGQSRSNWFSLLNEDVHETIDQSSAAQRDRDGSRRLVLSRSRHGTVAYRGGLTTQQQLVMMSIHVLRGLMYLHRHHLFHGDVATRNCFVDANLTVKLCDNALSRDLFPDEYNCLCDNLNRPIKWLAPETIQNFRQYTVASEMWSFGVLLWELLTKAQLPYLDLDPFEVFTCLYEGYRLPQPYSCPDDLYNFMLSCWTWQPSDRPTPHQMLTNLNKFYAKLGLFL